jgi:malate dehydrogenase (oxaloacetate-decarboxylating)
MSASPQPANDPREALRLHRLYRGKMQTMLKCPLTGYQDFAIWYTPGVAEASRAIESNPDEVYDLTNRGNTVAIVSDGSRVLGLGNIGPEAGLPVMEGKALLFKYLGGVDAVPVCVRTHSPDEIVSVVKALEPSFGGINLEDISQPKCFRVLAALREELDIPVWHDDQQGTATVVLAALTNALLLVEKQIQDVRITMVGFGAANVPTYKMLVHAGADPGNIIACDRGGILNAGRTDIESRQVEFAEKWQVCRETNGGGRSGAIAEALEQADVCIAFSQSGPDVIHAEWIARMRPDAIVFACANPVPEIWPAAAKDAGARIVATGRSDFPNQVNNSLVFPAVFRGALDVRARRITDEMAIAAADELALAGRERGIQDDSIIPTMDEWEVYPRVARATALQAIRQGVARVTVSAEDLERGARKMILNVRQSVDLLSRENLLGT